MYKTTLFGFANALDITLNCCAHAQNGGQVVRYRCVADEKRTETNRHLLKLHETFASTVCRLSFAMHLIKHTVKLTKSLCRSLIGEDFSSFELFWQQSSEHVSLSRGFMFTNNKQLFSKCINLNRDVLKQKLYIFCRAKI